LGEPTAPGFPFLIPNNFRNASLNHVYVFNPHLVNYANFGFHRTDVGNQQQEVFTWSDIGASAPPVANLFPVIGVAGSMSLGGNGQSVRAFQQHFNLEDSLTYVHGRHTFRFGGGYTHSRVSLANFTFFGAALFLSWPDFLLGLPAGPEAAGGNGTPFSNIFLSLDIPGDLDRNFIVNDGNAYIQDDIKVNSSLTLNLGLRYERLGHLADTGGRNSGFDINLANPNPPASGSLEGFLVSENFPGSVPAGVTQLDNRFGTRGKGQNTWAPRVGLAWRLPDSFLPFTEQMVLRGGYGIYRTRATGQAFLQLAASRPFAELRNFSGATNGTASFASPFQPEPVLPAFVPYSPTSQLNILLVDPNYRPPVTQEFSLNLQTDVGLNSLLEVGYVGSRGNHLIYRHSLNQAELASPSNPIRGETTNSFDNLPLRVPILGFTGDGLGDIESAANSWYHGLETSLTKRFSHGLQFQASYTFAHSYSDSADQTGATGFGVSGNQVNRRANYGRTDFNREHRFVFSYVYQLPSVKRFNDFVDKLLGGWSLAGVTTIQSGRPLTLTGRNATNIFGITSDRADLVPGCDLSTPGSVSQRLDAYLNANCIARLDPSAPFDATANPAVWPVIGDDGVATGFGNSRPGIVTGPGQNNSDIAIIKRTPVGFLGEGGNIEFRAEFFNAFNHPQFDLPDADVTSSTFGEISETAVNPRIIQLGLKVNF
jgi:hypothetical protein